MREAEATLPNLLGSLPDIPFFQMVRYLDLRSRVRLGSTCKRLCAAVFQWNPQLWAAIRFDLVAPKCAAKLTDEMLNGLLRRVSAGK